MSNEPGGVKARLRKLLQDTTIYSIALALSNFLGLIALLIFTRAFSPEVFGRYSSSFAVVAIMSTLLFGWCEQATVRFTADLDEDEVIQNLWFILALITGAFLVLAAIGYVVFGERLGPFEVFYIPVVILIVAQGIFQPLLMFFRGRLDSKSVARYRVIAAFLRFGLALVLALYVLDSIVGWLWGSAIAMLLTIGLAIATSDEVRFRPRFQRRVSGRMAAYGLPMIGFIIGDPFLTQVDRLLLEVLVSSVAVGIYSSNYILVDQGLRLAYSPVLQAMQPLVVSEWTGDNETEVRDIISDFTRYYLLGGVPVMVIGSAMGRPLASVLLDDAYLEGYVIIPLVAGGVFLWGLADAGQRGLELKEGTLTMSVGVVLTITVNVLLNIPLILAFGYVGAAFATFISSGLYVAYIRYVSKRYIEWRPPRTTIRNTVIGGLVMSVPPASVYLFGLYTLPRVFVASALAVPIYLGVIYALGEFRDGELREANKLYRSAYKRFAD